MKRKSLFLTTMALMFAFVSCQDNESMSVSSADEVLVNVNATAPISISTRAATAANSGLGGISNIDWEKHNLRYIMDIYDAEGNGMVKERLSFIATSTYQDASFSLRLTPNRTYKFVVWADFVTGEGDLHYDTSDLTDVKRIGDHAINDESRDAFFVTENVLVTGDLNKSLTLKRPFGKLRVVTTDIEELDLGKSPAYVKVTHKNTADLVTGINAVTGKLNKTAMTKLDYETAIDSKTYTLGHDADSKKQTLYVDYIFGKEDGQIATPFEISVYSDAQATDLIRTYDFGTSIPVQRNYLTTLIGNILTTATNITVQIDENFEGEYVIDIVKWDGKTYTEPQLDAVTNTYEIKTPAEFAWLSTTPINSMYTVKLMNDVDMGNGTINSIKFSGTFEGGNHTISNLIVDGVDTYSNGLFSGFGGVKKNFTLNNIEIKRYGTDDTSYAGAITGVIQDGCSMEIENVHVINSKIGGVQSIGGLIGYIAINTTFTATNCTVDGSVLSNDDIAGESGCMGGLVGRGGGKMTITNCKVSNSMINAYINDANQHKRTSSKFFGNFVGGNGVLTIAGCSVENVTLNAMGSNPEEQCLYGELFGGWRNSGGTVTVNGASCWDGVATNATAPANGDINSAADLAYYQGNNKSITATVTLKTDINLGSHTFKSMQLKDGTFDGNGKTLSNMIIESSDTYTNGLFTNYASGSAGVVKDLTIKNIEILAHPTDEINNYAAVIMAVVEGNTTLSNIAIDGAKVTGIRAIGAFVGFMNENPTLNITNCTAKNMEITNRSIALRSGYVGGLVGRIAGGTATVKDCSIEDSTIDVYVSAAIPNTVGELYGTINATSTFIDNTVKNVSIKISDI